MTIIYPEIGEEGLGVWTIISEVLKALDLENSSRVSALTEQFGQADSSFYIFIFGSYAPQLCFPAQGRSLVKEMKINIVLEEAKHFTRIRDTEGSQ